MPTVKRVFSLFASQENNRKSFRKFLLDSVSAVSFDHTLSEAANIIFVYISQFVFELPIFRQKLAVSKKIELWPSTLNLSSFRTIPKH